MAGPRQSSSPATEPTSGGGQLPKRPARTSWRKVAITYPSATSFTQLVRTVLYWKLEVGSWELAVRHPHPREQARDLPGRRVELRRRGQQVGRENRIPVAPPAIEKARGVERLDRPIETRLEVQLRGSLGNRRRKSRAGAQFRTKRWMRTEQKAWREIRPSEPPHGLAEAGGREIEQTQPLEQRGIAHRRVQRADELFGRIELGQRRPLVIEQRGFALGARATCARADRPAAGCRAASAESRSRGADRSLLRRTAASPMWHPRRVRCGMRAVVSARMAAWRGPRGTDRQRTAASPAAGSRPVHPPRRGARPRAGRSAPRRRS